MSAIQYLIILIPQLILLAVRWRHISLYGVANWTDFFQQLAVSIVLMLLLHQLSLLLVVLLSLGNSLESAAVVGNLK